MIDNKFEKLCVLGEGTYGIVYKARNLKTNEIVAIKKVRIEDDDEGMPSTTLREIATLNELDHPNIVKLLKVEYNALNKKLFLIFEYLPMDLSNYLKKLK